MQDNGTHTKKEFVTALTENQGALYAYIYLRLGNRDATQEILQETNIVMWKEAGRLDSMDHFLPWAKNLASLEIRHYLSENKRDTAKVVFDSDAVDALGETLAAPAEEESRYDEVDYEMLLSCLGKLPPSKRRVVARRYWDGVTVDCIAREMGTSYSTIAMQLSRIRTALGECIRRLRCRFGGGDLPAASVRSELLENLFDGNYTRCGEMSRLLVDDPYFRREWLASASIHAALVYNSPKLRVILPAWGCGTASLRRIHAVFLAAAAFAVLLCGIFVFARLAARPAQKQKTAPAEVLVKQESPLPPARPSIHERTAASPEKPRFAQSPLPAQAEQPKQSPAPARLQEMVAVQTAPAQILPAEEPERKKETADSTRKEKEMNALSIAAKAGALASAAMTGAALAASNGGALVDASSGPYWTLATGTSITLQWETNWYSGAAASALFTASGMVVRASADLDPAAGSYTWTPALGSSAEDLCALSLVFKDAAGGVLKTLNASLAVSKTGFQSASVLPDMTAKTWRKIKTPVLFPWDTSWAEATNTVAASTLAWTRDKGGSFSVTNAASYGMLPFDPAMHKTGEYRLLFTAFDAGGAAIGTNQTANVYIPQTGFVIMLK